MSRNAVIALEYFEEVKGCEKANSDLMLHLIIKIHTLFVIVLLNWYLFALFLWTFWQYTLLPSFLNGFLPRMAFLT